MTSKVTVPEVRYAVVDDERTALYIVGVVDPDKDLGPVQCMLVHFATEWLRTLGVG